MKNSGIFGIETGPKAVDKLAPGIGADKFVSWYMSLDLRRATAISMSSSSMPKPVRKTHPGRKDKKRGMTVNKKEERWNR
jgi:hypothetical protein